MAERNSRHAASRLNGVLYHCFSPYNFSHSNWLEAAKRFLELRDELIEVEELSDSEHPHEMFVSCAICDRSQELRSQYERFANYFAYVWAKQLVQRSR